MSEHSMWHVAPGGPWIVNPPPGAVFVLRAGTGWSNEDARLVADQLAKFAPVLVLPYEADFAVFPEEAMRNLGWCRCAEEAPPT